MPAKKEPVPKLDVAVVAETVESIKRIDVAMKTMLNGGLKKATIVTLLHASTKVSKTEIEKVLDGLSNLSRDFLDMRR